MQVGDCRRAAVKSQTHFCAVGLCFYGKKTFSKFSDSVRLHFADTCAHSNFPLLRCSRFSNCSVALSCAANVYLSKVQRKERKTGRTTIHTSMCMHKAMRCGVFCMHETSFLFRLHLFTVRERQHCNINITQSWSVFVALIYRNAFIAST